MADAVHESAKAWRSRLKQLAESVLDAILPPVCANCGKVGVLLCASCLGAMPRLEEPVCQRCGRAIPKYGRWCYRCEKLPRSFLQVRAAVLFAETTPRIVHQMKYNGVYALAEPLGNLMAECWPRWEARVDLILAIPLHPKRQRSRGYNQSDLLTEQLCARVDIPSGSRALKRTRDTRPQVDLNPTERLENVADAFWADAHDVAGKRVVMIDDVCTTGSTLMEAGKALLAAGAKSVAGYCLARVP